MTTTRDAIQSETVHTLIHQNEDLNSRLNATLRRTAQLELKIAKLEDAYGMTVRQNDALVNETDVLREKATASERLFIESHGQKEELQKTFAELYSRSRETEAELKLELNAVQEQVLRLSRYRQRVTKFVKPNLKKTHAREIMFEKQIVALRAEADRLRQTINNLNVKIEVEKIDNQGLEQSFHDDLARLASGYESQLGANQEELVKLRQDCERLKEIRVELSSQLEKVQDDRVRFENESIRHSRSRIQVESEKQALYEENQEQFAAQRLHIQSLELEVANLKELSKAAQVRVKETSSQLEQLKVQAADFKLVQDATLSALQDTSEREARSARLNVELSRALKDARIEVERLNIEAVAVKLQEPDAPTHAATESPADLGQRIENILAEIQGSQYLPQDWIETQASSERFKFAIPGNGITTPTSDFKRSDFKPSDFVGDEGSMDDVTVDAEPEEIFETLDVEELDEDGMLAADDEEFTDLIIEATPVDKPRSSPMRDA